MSILSVTSLTKKYKDTTAVRDVNFALSTGKCIALIGPNGAGKTTILRILAGLLKPTEGEISFAGQPKHTDLRKYIGYLPQYPVFPNWMTAREFLIFSGELAHLSKQEATVRAEKLAEEVGIKDAWNKRIGSFSGGMKQRLGIAQAMIHSPQLVLLDEPVSSLDPLGRREILNLLEGLKEKMTILFSTHILNDAEEICDELILLKQGEIIEAGAIADIRAKYRTSIIELEFQENPKTYLEKVKNLPNLENCYLERHTIKVAALDIEIARTVILKTAAEQHWPLIGFQLQRASLEELFMEAVKE